MRYSRHAFRNYHVGTVRTEIIAVYEHTPVFVGDKCVVVVGGTSGIGQAIVPGFVNEGTDALVTSRRKLVVDETADTIEELGVGAVRETYDVTDPAPLERARKHAIKELSGIDVVVTSQDAISRETVCDIDSDTWDHATDIVLGGIRRVTQELAPVIADSGSIINISPLAAWLSMVNPLAYSMAKDGVEAFTHASAKEPAPKMRVNAIAPGFIVTPQNADTYAEGTERRERTNERAPLGRVTEREKIAGATVFLTSDVSSFVIDKVVTVDGGFANNAF